MSEFIARSDDDLFMTRISLKITRKLYEERYYRDIFLLRDTRPLIVRHEWNYDFLPGEGKRIKETDKEWDKRVRIQCEVLLLVFSWILCSIHFFFFFLYDITRRQKLLRR